MKGNKKVLENEAKRMNGRRGARGETKEKIKTKKGDMSMLLFEPVMLLGGASIVGVALIDKFAEEYGYAWIGMITKLILPALGYAAGIYFIEANPLLRWLF